MTAQPVEDGNLPAARRYLADAIHALAGRTTTIIDVDQPDGRTEHRQRWGDSLYVQLRDGITGAQGTQLGASARSMPPLWVDAADTIHEIDQAVTIWQRDPGPFDGDLSVQRPPTPETVRRLRLLEARTWRPQDAQRVNQLADVITAWAAEIRALLNPEPKWTLPEACPACSTRTVYRRDSAGETVRQPALQIGPFGCECQRCHARWSPDMFVFLATKLLGYELPAGVLE